MVSRQADQRSAVTKMSWGMFSLIFMTAFLPMCLFLFLVDHLSDIPRIEAVDFVGACPSLNGVVNSNECESNNDVIAIDFQSVIDSFVNRTNGEKGIIIYDLMAGKIAGEYNADKKFATASIYKLFVVYAGYLMVDRDEWSPNSPVGTTGHSIIECLDLAIRESDSPCAETLWGMIGRDELDVIVQSDFDLPNVIVGSLSATPREIMRMMLNFYQHTEINNQSLVTIMKDSFLNQPITSYNWRQGLPSGFSDKARIYNKVGWEYDGSSWKIYDDAAIVSFPDVSRDFVVVVMTKGLNYKYISQFGRDLETKFYENY